ncbi:BQ2448_5325 [Microbotryum intermedium]|uniref:BQ2448_5325 protein n=1 Tax=Microbotryum intermedium TaxID=269621 RepID=A0A238F774_9BASI|nr:BQ2448_5325 [Microbotryum intermedium]
MHPTSPQSKKKAGTAKKKQRKSTEHPTLTTTRRFINRHHATVFHVLFWLVVLLYTILYNMMQTETFLQGSVPFLIGYTALTRLPYLSPSGHARTIPKMLSDTDREIFARFPASCIAVVFCVAGAILWTRPHQGIIDPSILNGDQSLLAGASESEMMVLAAILVTALVHGLVSLVLRTRKSSKSGKDLFKSVVDGLHSADCQFRVCIMYLQSRLTANSSE